MKKDVMYDRDYNSDEQAKKSRKELLYETARKEHYKIEKEYLDYNHYEKGSKLKELMQDIENGQVKTLIVRSMDRLSRNTAEALEVIDKVEKNGGQCLFIDTGLKKLSDAEKQIMKLMLEYERKELSRIRKYRNKEQILNEETFDIELKDKQIRIGNLLNHKNRGNIITDEYDVLGFGFDEFSNEQLEVKVIPKRLEKDDEEYLNIIVEFANEKDKELFLDRIEQEDFSEEDDELEM
ncbi:MAG: recombinase family protein [Clostridiales bacterium]|nr:recombinase family protein [Clostridiales bacterium]